MDLNEYGDALDDCDPEYHAPTEYVIRCREEREMRRKRDLNELQDLWREEVQARRRERAPLFYNRTKE